LPRWRFDMMYRAQFSRPAGLIYDCFDRARHTFKRAPLPQGWRRVLGLDFGAVNLVGVLFAQDPGNKRLYLERVYKSGGRTARQHVEAMRTFGRIDLAVGGAPSEQNWRDEFAAAGLVVRPSAVKDVEVGINRVYGAIANDGLSVCADLPDVLDEFATYARVLDESGHAKEEIEDKQTYHILDAIRYAVSEALVEIPESAGVAVPLVVRVAERSEF
jgi:hypothetical protein